MPEPTDPLLGTVLDSRYRVLGRIGEGGFGAVYTVRHVHTGKQFAIKVLHAEFAENRRIIERFWREAQTASLIDHENVVDIIDIGQTPDGSLYFSMELLRGEPLSALLQREGALPWPRARGFAAQIAKALCAAHAKGVVHRDLKPANCLRITRSDNPDFVKVLDFGIAKLVRSGESDAPGSPGLTSQGEVLGTPYYMAPEQAAGSAVDARADIFSFGVLLFELLTGQRPFQGTTRFEILTKMLTVPAPRVSHLAPHPGVPPAVDALVARMLQREPEQRPAAMTEVLASLQGVDHAPGEPGIDRGADEPTTVPREIAFATTVAASPTRAPAEPLSESRIELVTTMARGKSATSARRRRALWVALTALNAVGVVAIGMWVFGPSQDAPAVASPPVIERAPEPAPGSALVQAAESAPAVPQVVAPPVPVVVTPAATVPKVSSSSKKKMKTTTTPHPSSPLRSCEEALVALADKASGILAKCKGNNSGITSGDRLRVQLAGNGMSGKVTSSIVSSSGSVIFDECVRKALDKQTFPDVSGVQICRREFPLKVP